MISYNEYISLIKEALIYTHNINRYETNMSMELDSIGLKYQINIINKMSYDLNITNPQILKNKTIYKALFTITQNQFGYYPSYFRITLNNNMSNGFYFEENEFKKYINNNEIKNILIRFEAKYEYGLYTNDIEIPDKLYHLSPTTYHDKIMNIGLHPKSKKRISFYPSRIHLIYNIEDYENLLIKFKANDIINDKLNLKYNLYQINTENIKDNIIIHTDPNYENGYYTYDNIPPKNIKLIKENL